MAYNFFNLGIAGEEIKRRLNLLKNITTLTETSSYVIIDAGNVTEL